MGGSTDVVRLGERDTRDGGGQARIEDESGVHFVARICKPDVCPPIRVRGVRPDGCPEPKNLRLLRSEVAAAWKDISHALRGFYELDCVK